MRLTAPMMGIGTTISLLFIIGFTGISGKLGAKPLVGPTPELSYSWKNVCIVGGGFVTGIITHPKEKGLMYARTDIGGAYRWNETTRQWVPLTDHFGPDNWNFLGIESIGIDPTDPNRVYMAIGTYTNDWAGNGAMIRSTDRGASWKLTALPFKNGGNMDGRSAGERIAVDPNQPAHLLFGSRDNGLWESTDFGATWKQQKSFPITSRTNGTGIGFVLFDPTSGGKGRASKTIFVGVSDKKTAMYRSNDSGVTWKALQTPDAEQLPNHGVLDGQGNLYVSCGNGPGPNGMSDGAVWKLSLATNTWTDITPEKPGPGNTFGYGGVSVDARSRNTLVVSTMDRWSRHDTIFRSIDGGKSWQDLSPLSERDSTLSPYLNWGRPKADLGHWIGDIEIDPFNSDRVLYVTGATIWTSLDMTAADKKQPTHWVVGANGLEETVPLKVISPASGAPLFSAVGDIDGFRHTNFDESPRSGFYQPSHGTCTDIDFAGKNPNILARVHSSGGYSEDNGITWKDFASKPGESKYGHIAVSANGSSFVWTPEGRKGTFLSRDKGTNWTEVGGLPTSTTRLIADRENPSRFYAFDDGTLYTSEDGGSSFREKTTGLPKGNASLQAVLGKEGDIWLCSESSGLFHSTDGGKSFVKNESVKNAKCIGFGKPAAGREYPTAFLVGDLGTGTWFYQSDDAGATWVRINDEKTQFHSINSITGDPRAYGRVYLATAGRGVMVGNAKGL